DVDDPPEGGDGAVERTGRAQLLDIVDVAEAANRHQRRRVALSQEVLDVLRAQRRIGGDEDRADLRERELEDDPLGHVRRPEDDALAGRDAEGDEAARDRARFAVERPEGVPRPVDVDEGLAVRLRRGETRQQIADGQVSHRGRLYTAVPCPTPASWRSPAPIASLSSKNGLARSTASCSRSPTRRRWPRSRRSSAASRRWWRSSVCSP